MQCDIDIMGDDSSRAEAELLVASLDALDALGLEGATVRINDRRVLDWMLDAFGFTSDERPGVLITIDKLDKIGPDAVAELLQAEQGATPEQAKACLELAAISGEDVAVVERVRDLAASYEAVTDLLETGLSELAALIEAAARRAPGVVVADLKIARGLDYYTGSVYETVLVGHEQLGSICSGGRYDTLASDGKNTYPGVGLSVGVSRLVSRLLSAGLVTATRGVPTVVLVAVVDEATRAQSDDVAAALRARGIAADVAPTAAKFGKQIKFADRRGIPFVWFPGQPGDDGSVGHDQVKDIRSGDQADAEATTWEPPAADLYPRAVPTSAE